MENIELAGKRQEKEVKNIVLPRRRLIDGTHCAIRVSNEAGAVLARLQSRTGMNMKALASTIIIQAEDLIVYQDEDDEYDD